MLGRKDYTQQEVDHARATVDEQIAAWRRVVDAVDTGDGADRATAAVRALEPRYFTDAVLTLDRLFVHRLRMTTGKDGTPLNELELVVDGVMHHDGVLTTTNVIKYVPDQAVLKTPPGERVRLDADGYERLAKAVLAEVERKFLG